MVFLTLFFRADKVQTEIAHYFFSWVPEKEKKNFFLNQTLRCVCACANFEKRTRKNAHVRVRVRLEFWQNAHVRAMCVRPKIECANVRACEAKNRRNSQFVECALFAN